MAGQARKRAMLRQAEIEMQADDCPSLLAWVLEKVRSGIDVAEVCRQLKAAAGVELNDGWLNSYMIETYGDEYRRQVRAARKDGAFAKIEEAQHIVDQAPETNEGIRKAEARAKTRQWVSERANREELGVQNGVNVNVVNVSMLHLDALRKVPRELPSGEITVVKGELSAGTDEQAA